MSVATSNQERSFWLLVIIATTAGIAAASHVGKIPPVLAELRNDLSINVFQSGLVVSAFSLLAVLISLPVGVVSARLGAFKMVIIALFFLGVGGLISACAPLLEILLASRLLEGLGYVIIAVTVPAIISQVVSRKDRALALGIWAAWVPAGISVMLVMAPLMLQFFSWRSVWMGTALFALCWIVVMVFAFRNQATITRPETAPQSAKFSTVLTRGPLTLALCFTCYSALFTVTASFLPLAWFEIHAISIDQASYFTSIAVFANVFGNILGGWLVGKQVSIKILLTSALVIPGSLAGLIYIAEIPLLLQFVIAGVFFCLGGMLPGAMFAVAPYYTANPSRIPLVVGLLFQGAALGQFIGPVLFSSLVQWGENWAWGAPFYFLVALTGAVLIASIQPIKYSTREAVRE